MWVVDNEAIASERVREVQGPKGKTANIGVGAFCCSQSTVAPRVN